MLRHLSGHSLTMEVDRKKKDLLAFLGGYSMVMASFGLVSRSLGYRGAGPMLYPWLTLMLVGKAGSGKSTLMKFLASDLRTRKALTSWSGKTSLFVARHFFWHARTTLQKSQQGLLQSLLFQLLSRCPRLIPVVCPDLWGKCESEILLEHSLPNWTLEELFRALEILQNQDLSDIRLCAFIDGLDEYNGDHWDIINMIFKLTSSPSIKICKFP